MIYLKVGDNELEILITGLDAWLLDTPRRTVRVNLPLSQVTSASVDPDISVTARSRHELAEGLLVCAKRQGMVLRIDADGHPWRSITLSVPRPEEMAATIRAKLRQSGR